MDDPEKVLKAIRPHLGAGKATAPRVPLRFRKAGDKLLGARSHLIPEQGVAGGTVVYQDETLLGRTIRREAAESTGNVVTLDPDDIEESIRGARSWMDTIGASRQDTDEVLEILMRNQGGSQVTVTLAANRMQKALRGRLVELGYDADDVNHIMRQFLAGTVQAA
jgi:hypothetical protein